MNIVSFSPFGYEGSIVTIEVDLRRGIPAVDIVGLADGAIKESRERMHSAIINSGFDFPRERVLISLSPADLKKEGAGFDLAIALAVLMAQKRLEGMAEIEGPILVMGELELSGKVRPVRGIHAAVSTAFECGVRNCIVCSDNKFEAGGVEGMNVFECNFLSDAFACLEKIGRGEIDNCFCSKIALENSSETDFGSVQFPPIEEGTDFAEVKNQPFLVRGLQIAAAGRHNLLAFGSPGCGKTLALQRFVSLLPYLDEEEARSVTRIHSLAGLVGREVSLVRKRPFRMPHQSASLEGVCGGGVHCAPGEVSLAHNGVLFLDEAAEFRSSVLQMLRVPLEQHTLTLCRAGRSTVYPADFQLLLATNPCPCGNFGSREKICLCSVRSVEQYWKKFSAPLLDRIDIRIPVESVPESGTSSDFSSSVSSAELRVGIGRAIHTQKVRQGKYNSRLYPEEVNLYCALSSECNQFLDEAAYEHRLSARAVSSCKKIARTIADMEGHESIEFADLEEAVKYRKNEGGLSLCC
ncbi:MAG: YifB family Mg chelatase-like AAA ATPase [Treponemataceae bacterium]|nr:YifB family Mg chelatase-like AAA ATPase [Treponemataceae bacterium]